MKDRPYKIGGQALIEGVMMKGPDKYAVAVRKPDGSIDIQITPLTPNKYAKIPFVRGIVSLFGSLSTGYRCLMRSAEISLGRGEEEDGFDRLMKKLFGEKRDSVTALIAGSLGVFLALGLFMAVPTLVVGLVDKIIPLGGAKTFLEAAVKLAIFTLYLWAVSCVKEMSRLFAYHGAEHKSIFCYEKGLPLTVENARSCSRFHPRCGTSFMFFVLAVSIVFFSFIPWEGVFARVITKLLFLPLAVSVAYEIQRYCGSHDGIISRICSSPGLIFQHLTTREPDDDMLEVALRSVSAVTGEEFLSSEGQETKSADESSVKSEIGPGDTCGSPDIENEDEDIPAASLDLKKFVSSRPREKLPLRTLTRMGKKIISCNPQSDPDFEADQLLKFVTGSSRLELGPDYVVPGEKRQMFLGYCNAREAGYPLQYILGTWDFFDLHLSVGPGVLIPRRDTERVCVAAFDIVNSFLNPNVLDLCSGSGAIALAIKKYCPDAVVVAVEKYGSAYSFLEKNISGTGLAVIPVNMDVFKLDFAVDPGTFDVIISNPPYVDENLRGQLQQELSYEPPQALYTSDGGLRFYKFIAKYYMKSLKPGGYMIFEHGFDQGKQVESILKSLGYTVEKIIYDLSGTRRGIAARKDEGADGEPPRKTRTEKRAEKYMKKFDLE